MANPFIGTNQFDYVPQMNAVNDRLLRPNVVIGGDASINPWQRGTSFAAPANQAVNADRWKVGYSTAGVVTVSKQASAPSVAQAGKLITHCFKIAVTTIDAAIAATDFFTWFQNVEGLAWVPFAQRALCLRFWHAHNKAGTYCVALRNGLPDRSYVIEYVSDGTAAWTEVEVDIPASPSDGTWNYTAGTVGMQMTFALMAGSNLQGSAGSWLTGNFVSTANQANGLDNVANVFQFADVRLVPYTKTGGGIEVRSAHEELLRCMRYTQKSFPLATAPAQNAGVAGARRFPQVVGGAVSQSLGEVRVPVRLCKAPTVTIYSPSLAGSQVHNIPNNTACSLTAVANQHEGGYTLSTTTPGGGAVAGNELAWHDLIDAEI
jgi:hypothetical protein